jgi:hypothetical protein
LHTAARNGSLVGAPRTLLRALSAAVHWRSFSKRDPPGTCPLWVFAPEACQH